MSDRPTDTPTVATTRRTRRRWLKLAIGLPILALVWWFVIRQLVASFREIDWANLRIGWGFCGLSIVSLLCARLTNALNCKQVLGAMGQRIRAVQVVPIIWVASLGRYVPGKVTVVAGAVAMLMRLGIRLHLALAALFLSTALMILIGLMASTPLLLFLPALQTQLPFGWIAALVAVPGGIVCLHPHVFTRLCNVALRRMKREPLPDRLALAPYLRAVGMTVLRTLFLGSALWCAARSLGDIRVADFPITLGAAGLASCIGFLAVFAPAGLGVHEAVYIGILTPLIGVQAGFIAVVFRFFNILADAITGAVGVSMLRGSRGAEAAGAGPTDAVATLRTDRSG